MKFNRLAPNGSIPIPARQYASQVLAVPAPDLHNKSTHRLPGSTPSLSIGRYLKCASHKHEWNVTQRTNRVCVCVYVSHEYIIYHFLSSPYTTFYVLDDSYKMIDVIVSELTFATSVTYV